MGYDQARFEEEVDEELICPICSNVLEDPLQAPSCEHAFCRTCITAWLDQRSNCPVDRQAVAVFQLEPVPRILRNLLGRLRIKCSNRQHGCEEVVRLDALRQHESACEANPSRPVTCAQGCSLTVPYDQIQDHNCTAALRELVINQQEKVENLSNRLQDHETYMSNQSQEIRTLKAAVQSLSLTAGSSMSTAWMLGRRENGEGSSGEADRVRELLLGSGGVEDGERSVAEWARSLPRARVSHWGRLISTPDAVLQAVVRESLTESGCGAGVADELMSRSDERGWPPGLRSLEMRQLHRASFSRFICRRLPANQAVLLLSCENTDLPTHMSLHPPGIVMIFANGVDSVTSL